MNHNVDWEDVVAVAIFENDNKERIRASKDWRERLRAIKVNYDELQKRVDAGKDDWMTGCPYQIANWVPIFTPIEEDMWGEIRCAGRLPFWPQLPVGRFFVDFGNPILKIAIECDGKEFHDPIKDMKRDDLLADMGWMVFRATGAMCRKVMEHPIEHSERIGYSDERYEHEYRTETLAGLIEEIKECVEYRRKDIRGYAEARQ